MAKQKLVRLLKTLVGDFFRGNLSRRNVSTILLFVTSFFLVLQLFHKTREPFFIDDNIFEINNFGSNVNLVLNKTRFTDVNEDKLKTILMWNDAYGVRTYDIGFGRQPFYTYKCPDTRCVATSNRSYLPSVDDFDAVIIHQRAYDPNDLPQKRKPHQRYVQWVMESAQYIYMDIHQLDGFFNWTMTYRRDSDFYLPYGRFRQIKEHPTEKFELQRLIKDFGIKNKHLAGNRTENKAAWFVSHCATQARRERYAKAMQKHMDVHIYGKCSRGKVKYECSRDNEWDCYEMLQQNYKFYLSFENSVCDDYVTEKYFNILKYDVIPVTFSGTNFSAIGAPPHSSINVLDFASPKKLVEYLEKLNSNDELYAEYFWWKDYYEIRNRGEDRAQPYCDLCARLNDPNEPPKVYKNMFKWWVTDSHCKKLKSSAFGS